MRIEKVSQTTPTSAQIVDGYSTSTTDGYSANYVNNYVEGLHTYSTTETTVGTYMNKPLYRKVIPITTYTGSFNVSHNISNLDLVVNFVGRFKRADGVQNSSTTVTDTYGIKIYDISSTNFKVEIGSSLSNNLAVTTLFVILEYTKTTD